MPHTLVPIFSSMERKRVGRAVIQATGCGPYDGGCVAFAEALQRRVGGTVSTLRSPSGAEHAILDYHGVLVDFEGAMNERAILGNFKEWQTAILGHHAEGCFVESVGPRQPEDFQRAPVEEAMIEAIAQSLPKNIKGQLDKAAVKVIRSQNPQAQEPGVLGGVMAKLRSFRSGGEGSPGLGASRPTSKV